MLVEGASHPSAAELPPDLEALSYRNAWELTERRFADDVAELARRLDEAVAESAASETGSVSDDLSSAGVGDTSDPPVRSPRRRGPRWWWQIERPKQLLVIGGLAVGVAAFAVAATILVSLDNSGGLDQPTPEERQLAINQLMESNDATEAQAECLLGSVIDEHGWSIASYYVFEEEEGTLDPLEDDPIIARWGVCRMSDE